MPAPTDPQASSPGDEPDFSVEEVMRVQRRLREALGLGPERFPLPAFVGMISDEIEQLHAAGRSDREVADLITASVGRPVSPDDLARFFASPDARRGPGR